MGAPEREAGWCRVCQTQHAPDSCPGYVEVTGPERPSRRFAARRDGKIEFYQTLVAQAGERWLARIATVPNRMWSVPGGGGTAKFLDGSAEGAESKAVRFIYTRCASLGVDVNEVNLPVDEPGDAPPSRTPVDARNSGPELPALFGEERPMWPAKALNLTREGLYLATTRVEPIGTRVVIKMQLAHFHTPLAGIVAWVNTRATETEPAGMGIVLQAPPFAYCRYVESLEPAPAG